MSGYQVPDRFEVLAFNSDQQADAVLCWEGDNYDFTVIADGPWGHVTGRADDCFEALTRIREQIEPQGWLLGVNGSRRDTWPSGMCREMGVSSSTCSGPGFAPPVPIASRHSTPHPARRWPLSPSRSPPKTGGASRCDHPGRPRARLSPGHRRSTRPAFRDAPLLPFTQARSSCSPTRRGRPASTPSSRRTAAATSRPRRAGPQAVRDLDHALRALASVRLDRRIAPPADRLRLLARRQRSQHPARPSRR